MIEFMKEDVPAFVRKYGQEKVVEALNTAYK
jgi:hypothetical protein